MLLVVPSFGVWSIGEKKHRVRKCPTPIHVPSQNPESSSFKGHINKGQQKKSSGKDTDVFPVE